MTSLRIVPLLPPMPRPGQRCFDFLRLSIVVLPTPAGEGARRRISRARHEQREIDWTRPAIRRHDGLIEYRPRKARPGSRARSLGLKPMTVDELAELNDGMEEMEAAGFRRPETRAECPTGPCPWYSCRHHLGVFVDEVFGAVKEVFPGRDFDELEETCALREAERTHASGEHLSFERIGALQNLTLERASVIAERALAKIKLPMMDALDDDIGGDDE